VPHFIVIRESGAAWDSSRPMREQDGWEDHAAFMDGLADEGFVLPGGPLGEDRRFLHVVEAQSEAHIHARLDADPWTPLGLLRTASVEPWRILLGERRLGGGYPGESG
jgi:hypothetical protein